jgi:hypothetical protein
VLFTDEKKVAEHVDFYAAPKPPPTLSPKLVTLKIKIKFKEFLTITYHVLSKQKLSLKGHLNKIYTVLICNNK